MTREEALEKVDIIKKQYYKNGHSSQWLYKEIEKISFLPDGSSYFSEDEIWEFIDGN